MSSACTEYSCRKSSGFSLIELIAVIIVLGVISVVAIPRFSATDTAAVQSARDQALSAIFTAQQIAMARAGNDNTVKLEVDTNGLNVTENDRPLTAAGGSYPMTFPEGVTITSSTDDSYTFDKLGRTQAGEIVLSRGATSVTIKVEASGYAYTP